MRIQDLDEAVGRIVKGVNTTPDVGVGQTSKEAAKFGFKVDKDGRPPLITKKSNNKTNTLFNLGLTEGIKLKLERDKHIDVLHIMDTNDKQRIEVRGKKGYESDGYDPQDKLHQVLDRVGKAANISELMNGEVVSINPNHPQGTRAIRTAQDVLQTESNRSEMEQACIEGGHSLDDLDAPTPTIAELIKMHNVPTKVILDQLTKGIEAEYEHTSDFEVAKQIAMDHLGEDPYYYDKLKFIENFADGKKNEVAPATAPLPELRPADFDQIVARYKTKQPSALAELIKKFAPNILIMIAAAIGLAHLSFLQKFLIKQGINFSRKQMQKAMAQVESIEENFADGKNQIKEALDNPYPFTLQGPDSSHNFAATAETPNGVLRMDFEAIDYDDFSIDFAVAKSMGKTGAGDEFRTFATVVAMMNKWISVVGIEHVEGFDFAANKTEHASDGREKLYARFAKKLADQLGWKLKQSTTADRSTAFFQLTNPKPIPRDDDHWDDLEDNPDLEENFADGKKKGKSRPGRVKRSGASCNGSVTALRKRAKKASGEKAKMLHWCANMKSGRQK